MKLFFENKPWGLNVRYKKKNYRLVYPKKIWNSYPQEKKEVLTDNLAYIFTINISQVTGKVKKIKYNTSQPFFRHHLFEVTVKSIPQTTEDYKHSAFDIIKRLLNTRFEFKNDKIKVPNYKYKGNYERKSINTLSFGKDSLLSLAVCDEIGLKPTAVYINDTVSPSENKIKLSFINFSF